MHIILIPDMHTLRLSDAGLKFDITKVIEKVYGTFYDDVFVFSYMLLLLLLLRKLQNINLK